LIHFYKREMGKEKKEKEGPVLFEGRFLVKIPVTGRQEKEEG